MAINSTPKLVAIIVLQPIYTYQCLFKVSPIVTPTILNIMNMLTYKCNILSLNSDDRNPPLDGEALPIPTDTTLTS